MLRLGAALIVILLSDVRSAGLQPRVPAVFRGSSRLWLLEQLGDGFTLLCLLGLLNAVNMADGKNGIVIGMGLIWTVVLAAHAPAAMLPVLAAAFHRAGGAVGLQREEPLGDGGCAISALFGCW